MKVIVDTKRNLVTIPYDPQTKYALVKGEDILKARRKAGYKSGLKFALVCGWNHTKQVRYEKEGEHEIPIENIEKMIRVCNGEK